MCEPLSGHSGDRLQRSALFEQMGCTRHYGKVTRTMKTGGSGSIEPENIAIRPTNNEKGGTTHACQSKVGEVGPSTTRNHGSHSVTRCPSRP